MTHAEHEAQVARVRADDRYPASWKVWMEGQYRTRCEACGQEGIEEVGPSEEPPHVQWRGPEMRWVFLPEVVEGDLPPGQIDLSGMSVAEIEAVLDRVVGASDDAE